MDPTVIAALGTAAGLVISAIIAATAKALKGHKAAAATPEELPLEVRIALTHIAELRALTQDEAIERVHSAESRRVILSTASTLEALVLGIGLDRDNLRSALRDATEERQRLLAALQTITQAIQKLS